MDTKRSEISEPMHLTAMLGHVGAVEMYLWMATPKIASKRKKAEEKKLTLSIQHDNNTKPKQLFICRRFLICCYR